MLCKKMEKMKISLIYKIPGKNVNSAKRNKKTTHCILLQHWSAWHRRGWRGPGMLDPVGAFGATPFAHWSLGKDSAPNAPPRV